MSKVNCDACADLREYAPDFVLNGVTDTVATSLKNDTGFNPTLTALHSDCEDLNDANDCLIGRMDGEIEAYDVCDWKEFMHKFLPNLYELLKAIIAAICGLWTRVHLLCDSIDTVLSLIRGDRPTPHTGEWFQTFLDKFEWELRPDGAIGSDSEYHPSFDADIISGAGCRAGKRLGRWQLNTYWDTSVYPKSRVLRLTAPIDVGELIGSIPRSAVPESDFSAARWKGICIGAGLWQWYVINRDTIWYISARGYVTIDGITYNEDLASYGEETLVFYVHSFIGPSRQGELSSLDSVELKTYDL